MISVQDALGLAVLSGSVTTCAAFFDAELVDVVDTEWRVLDENVVRVGREYVSVLVSTSMSAELVDEKLLALPMLNIIHKTIRTRESSCFLTAPPILGSTFMLMIGAACDVGVWVLVTTVSIVGAETTGTVAHVGRSIGAP